MRSLPLLMALATSLAAVAMPAAAQTVRTVRVADLDLSDPRQVAVMNRRIARAVEGVCGSYASVEPRDADTITACRRDATTGIREQLAARAQSRDIELAVR